MCHFTILQDDLDNIKKYMDSHSPNVVIDIVTFSQSWPSTSLGFGGIGGQAITTANTIVVVTSDWKYWVFFGGAFAYNVINPNDKFLQDLMRRSMCSCSEASKRYQQERGI